ncbi:MAG: hypothetical protein ACNA8W_24780 [Bradymonadaceae bacterium]
MSGGAEQTVARVDAPKGVTAWTEAEVKVYHEVTKGGGAHGSGPTTFERVAVEIWVHGDGGLLVPDRGMSNRFMPSRITFDSYMTKKPMLIGDGEVRRIRRRPYELVVSPDGEWLAFSSSRGKWLSIHVESLLLCRHVHLDGGEPNWNGLVPIRDLVLDILAHKAGKQGPLGLEHVVEGRGHSSWDRSPMLEDVSELWAAANWARAHGDDEEVQHAVADVMLGLGNNARPVAPLTEALAGGAATHRSVRERLLKVLAEPSASATAVRLASVALADSPDGESQAALSGWLLANLDDLLSGEKKPLDYAGHYVAWALAKVTRELGEVDALTQDVALAIAGSEALTSGSGRTMRCFAIHLLAMMMADSKEVIELLEKIAAEGPVRDRQPSWPPVYEDVGTDANNFPTGTASPEAWAQVILEAMESPGPGLGAGAD